MNFLIYLFLLSTLAYPQKIFDSFEQERKSRYRYTEQYTFDPVLDDGTSTIRINGFKGDISIIGHVGSGVKADLKMNIKVLTEKRAKIIIDQNKVHVQYNRSNKIIHFIGPKNNIGRVSYTLELKIPMTTNLIFNTIGGDIEAENIQGEFHFKTGGGDIELSELNGKGTIETAGGTIDIDHVNGRFTLLSRGGDIDASHVKGIINIETAGGDIEMEHITGNADVATRGGSIFVSFYKGQHLIASTSGGDIHVGLIEANVDLKTVGGDITIKKLFGNALATTGGGDIKIEDVHGNIDCINSGGSIKGVNLFGAIKAVNQAGDIVIAKEYDTQLKNHSIDLTSFVGDIELIIPDDFPASVHIEHNGENATSAIESEFYLDENNQGGNLNATTSLLSGDYPCKITIHHSGDIKISKD
ncbi:MAG: hypothetical protein ISR83_03445 [Candidatus Marinimicrobia bacterium]|nr:hypothetical protein [Candidatus Neomarinimicrobiota bacterium]